MWKKILAFIFGEPVQPPRSIGVRLRGDAANAADLFLDGMR